jgi:hypothetical protein
LADSGRSAQANSVVAEEPKELGIAVTLRLDKHEVAVGSAVKLDELVPNGMDIRVNRISHHVLRIGRYDKNLRRLVNLDKSQFVHLEVSNDFDGLPWSRTTPHSVRLELLDRDSKGTEFSFRPRRIGIFLITAAWIQWTPYEIATSQPIVLVVKPPKDMSGHDTVKPEWLEESSDSKTADERQ